MGEIKRKEHRNIRSHNKTHTRVPFHHMVTTSIRHKHQQTTDNTKHRTQNSNWVYNRHNKIHTQPIREHLKLHASHIRQKSQQPTHYTTLQQTPRRKKQTTYNNTDYTTNIDTNPNTIDDAKIKTHMKHIHTTTVSIYLNNRQHNTIPLTVHHSETTFPRATHHTLAQLRTNTCPHLRSYLNKIDEVKHPSPLCPLCKTEPCTTTHLFNCTNINTQLQVTDLWTAPVEVGHLLVEWRGHQSTSRPRCRLDGGIPSAGVHRNGCWTPASFFGGADNNNPIGKRNKN